MAKKIRRPKSFKRRAIKGDKHNNARQRRRRLGSGSPSFTEDFEGVANGVAVTSANTNFEDVVFDTPHSCVGDNTWSITGSISALMDVGDTDAAARMRHTYTRENRKRFVRWYMRVNTPCNGFDRLFTAEDNAGGNGNSAILTWITGSQLRLTGSSPSEDASIVFAGGEVLRIEMMFDPVSDLSECRFYYTNPHASIPSYDERLNNTTPGGLWIPDDWEVGAFNNGPAWNANFDAIAESLTGWVGPI